MAIRFTNILRDLIIESSRFQVIYDKYVKPRKGERVGSMPFETLFAIVAADPTSRIPEGMDIDNAKPEDMEKVKIGKYTQWLLKNFTTPNVQLIGITDPNDPGVKMAIKRYQELFMEDLYKVTGDLMKFERFKNRLPQEARDINKLTPETLYDQVKDFSLEKTKATADEKKEASKTYQHPGAEIVYRGSDWTVAKISDTGQLGKDAACFYGGYYLEPTKGETRWCTSSPGLTWFDRYIKDGPLYVVIPNSPRKFTGSMDIGEKSGLPAFRYQFHFPSNQYMDPADRQINLVEFLMKQEQGLKDYFKPEFMKGLTSGDKQKKVSVNYPGDSASKFIALYGFDEFFETLPSDIIRLEFISKGDGGIELPIPNTIGRFTELTSLHLVGCVSKIPESICNLKKLQFLSLPDNPNMEKLPSCLSELPNLSLVNLSRSNPEKTLPDTLKQRLETDEDFHVFPPVAT
jgi:Leucine-rich repeat (LRR) protein